MSPSLLAALICCGIAAYWCLVTIRAASRKAKGRRFDDED